MINSEILEKVNDLPAFIRYLEATTPEEWQVDTVRSVGNAKNCVMGHLINYVYGKDYEASISEAWDYFEEIWSSTFFIYDVNDGKNEQYRQPTARERIITYLSDLWLGIRVPTWRAYELYSEGIYDITKYEEDLAL